MKRVDKIFLLGAALLTVASCDNWSTLNIPPQTILTDERVWGDPNLVKGVVADYYSRLPMHQTLTGGNGQNFTSYDEAIWSAADNGEVANTHITYAYNRWSIWDAPYGLIRDINLAIEGIDAAQSAQMTPALKTQFIAEMRFIRALVYFELVKRMGGVPIITSQLIYDFSGNPEPLRLERDTEAEVYDFIWSELETIQSQLGNAGSQTRANAAAALALKSRAMLYAGSLARHNNELATPITLPGGIVGIPAARANEYYQKSLDASRALITGGTHQLYTSNPNRGENFYEAVTKKEGNNEVIFATDYNAAQGRAHGFTRATIPRGLRRDVVGTEGGSSTSPTVQLVETFDHLDGSPGAFTGVGTGSNTAAGQADWVYYNQPEDIFANRDARLYGTIIYPGTSFAGEAIRLQAGVYVWNEAAGKYDRTIGTINSNYTDGLPLTGQDGPNTTDSYVSTTGFLLRKYLDTDPGARSTSTDSDVWWVWFRLGEIYLNAAEAALELGLQPEAVGYVNTLRQRAGFPANSLTSVDRAKIRNERRVELAFEDHRVWDLIRWRIADQVWDGTPGSTTANAWSLYMYRIYRPGHPNHNKYVFDRIRATRQTQPRNFRVGNYYSEIPNNVLNANPKLIRNPFH